MQNIGNLFFFNVRRKNAYYSFVFCLGDRSPQKLLAYLWIVNLFPTQLCSVGDKFSSEIFRHFYFVRFLHSARSSLRFI